MQPTRTSASILLFAAIAAAQQPTAPKEPTPALPTTLTGAWRFAQSLLRTHKVPVLVFVLPAADAPVDAAVAARSRQLVEARLAANKVMGALPVLRADSARAVFLLQLQVLRSSANEQLRQLLLCSAAVVAEAATAGARPGETVVLLGADGKREHGFALDLLDEDAVVQTLAPILLDQARLAARQANLAPALKQDLAEYERLERARQRSEADTQRLAELRDRLAPVLPAVAPVLLAAPTAAAPGRSRGPGLLGSLAGPELPLGTAIDQMIDPCAGCGMAYVPPRLTSTLKLLAQ